MAKERSSNVTCNDTVILRLHVYNANTLRDVESVDSIDIYFLDPNEITETNTDGRRLVQTIAAEDVSHEETGKYYIELELSSPLYTIGDYLDIWNVVFEDTECATVTIENKFEIVPDLWFTTPTPPIYDFSFHFKPTRMNQGTKRYIIVEIVPNVPNRSDLIKYYENLAIVADIKISMEFACGACVPAEEDLRLIIDRDDIDYREKRYGYYLLDTTDLDKGIYNIWFELTLGEAVYISDKQQLQIS